MKTLVLCRHAKSDWPIGVSDMERPLKNRGIRDASFLGELLVNQEFIPDLIISSPAKRALSTAQIVASKLNYTLEDIKIEDSVYYEGGGHLLGMVQDLPDSVETVMVFGHNPTMETAVRTLLQSGSPFEMPTCGMVCFESTHQHWANMSSHSTYLRWYLIPRLKRKQV